MTIRKTITKTRRNFYVVRCIHADTCLWCGMEKYAPVFAYVMSVLYVILTSLSPLPKTLQHILLNFQCILTVNHYILEFLVPERTLKFQEITDFRKLSNFNKNKFFYILLNAYAFILK
jgi:hypothetical protein